MRVLQQLNVINHRVEFGYYFLKRDYERHASALQQCVSNEAKARYKAVQMANKGKDTNASV